MSRKGATVLMSEHVDRLPAFSELYPLIMHNPQSLEFVQALGNTGLSPDKIEELRIESHRKARAGREERSLPPEAIELTPSVAESTGSDEKPCSFKCTENRIRLKQIHEQSRREATALQERLRKLNEDFEDARRINAELELDCKATHEQGQQIRMEILAETRREAELRDSIRAAHDERSQIGYRMARLENEVQKKRNEIHELDAQLRVLIWSAKSNKSEKEKIVGASDNQQQDQRDSVDLVFVPPRPATSSPKQRRYLEALSSVGSVCSGISTSSKSTKADKKEPQQQEQGEGEETEEEKPRRELFSRDGLDPAVSRRYMGLVQDSTIDVMERWQNLRQQAHGHEQHQLPRASTAPAGTTRASRLLQGLGAHSRCTTPMVFDYLKMTPLSPPASPTGRFHHHQRMAMSDHAEQRTHTSMSERSAASALSHRTRPMTVGMTSSRASFYSHSTLSTLGGKASRGSSRKGGKRGGLLGVPLSFKLEGYVAKSGPVATSKMSMTTTNSAKFGFGMTTR